MADLALNSSLIDEYVNYTFNEPFDTNKMRKLLKYISSFYIKINHPLLLDPAIPMQLGNDPLIEIIDSSDDEEVVQNSILKLMLIDKAITPTPSFTTVNIVGVLPEKLQPKYGATYPNATDKIKAQKHIKTLLSNAQWIKITDSYIANNQWNDNKTLLASLVSHTAIQLTLVGGNGKNIPKISPIQESELKSICADWKIQTQPVGTNIHDRYIETDKVKILLSSGLYHLSTTSDTDFTYIIEIK